MNYTYDADSLRVEKSSGTLYWRTYTGQVIEETNTSGNLTTTTGRDYIFFGGRRIAWDQPNGSGGWNVCYYFADAIGSTRAVTNTTGNVCFSADYYPYGQENDYVTSCSPTYKFAGYEYDSETGNYYAYARYYNPRLARFMSPDPLGGSVDNPQSLNRYTYVLNNPESLVDPLGLWCYQATENGDGLSWSCPSGQCSASASMCQGGGGGGGGPQPCSSLAAYGSGGDMAARAVFGGIDMGAGGCNAPGGGAGGPAGVQKKPPQTQSQGSANPSAEQTCGGAAPMSSSSPDPYGPLETYAGINAQAMFQNGGNGTWGQDVRGCLACMHSQGASMSTSHEFCYAHVSAETGPLQTVEGLSRAIWAATETGLRQLTLAPWPGTPPFLVLYSPVPWR